jgi:hypothetical protein
MLKDFDIAFTNKIKSYFSNTIYANTALVYNVAYDLVDDPTVKLEFPLISIYRPTGFQLAPQQNFAARKLGYRYYNNDELDKSSNIRYLVVNLSYQLDIYTKTPESLNDITEELMHALSLDSTIEVSQYDSNTENSYVDTYEITYGQGPQEASEFQNGDRVYHYSIVYNIDNARLLNFKENSNIIDTEVITEIEQG